jgi:hypothetical protein
MTKGVPVYMPKKEYKCKICGGDSLFSYVCGACRSMQRREKKKIKN